MKILLVLVLLFSTINLNAQDSVIKIMKQKNKNEKSPAEFDLVLGKVTLSAKGGIIVINKDLVKQYSDSLVRINLTGHGLVKVYVIPELLNRSGKLSGFLNQSIVLARRKTL